MIEIDGSFGEGGGQILRSALTLSLLTAKAFRLKNIRAGRKPKPGLRPQHLACVRAAASIGTAKTYGDQIGSFELIFEPGPVRAGNYQFDIGTAGSTSLVLQTIALPLILRSDEPSQITIAGGTHVPHSPSFHFVHHTWLRHLDQCGISIQLEMPRAGFYPRGGGTIEAHLEPCLSVLPYQSLTRPEIKTVTGLSAVAGLPDHILERQEHRAKERLSQRGLAIVFDRQIWEGGPGSFISLATPDVQIPPLFAGLGERGKRAEAVADEAIHQFLDYLDSGAPVDEYSADQIVLVLSLSSGLSSFRTTKITNHLLTNIAVIKQFIDRDITCSGQPGSVGTITLLPQLV